MDADCVSLLSSCDFWFEGKAKSKLKPLLAHSLTHVEAARCFALTAARWLPWSGPLACPPPWWAAGCGVLCPQPRRKPSGWGSSWGVTHSRGPMPPRSGCWRLWARRNASTLPLIFRGSSPLWSSPPARSTAAAVWRERLGELGRSHHRRWRVRARLLLWTARAHSGVAAVRRTERACAKQTACTTARRWLTCCSLLPTYWICASRSNWWFWGKI